MHVKGDKILENKKYWIWLNRINGLGIRKKQKLLQKYHNPQNIWNLSFEELINIEGIEESLAKEITNESYKKGLEEEIAKMKHEKIFVISIYDDIYPKKLKKLYDAPILLYAKGNIELLKNLSIAIIGCREYSEYGKNMAMYFSYQLAKKGITVISGLAKGIDSFAHMSSLNTKGNTIAVVGNGLDIIYPKENINLQNKIIKQGGLILSEYPLGVKPDKYTFPARNRIISGLSDGVLVIEAKEKSGTLITVDFALEQGKNVFSIPGNITSKNTVGTNRLIKEGAKCVIGIEDILEEYKNIKFL